MNILVAFGRFAVRTRLKTDRIVGEPHRQR